MLPEYYEYIARLAFRYYEIQLQNGQVKSGKENFKKVADFVARLLNRQIDLGNLRRKKSRW